MSQTQSSTAPASSATAARISVVPTVKLGRVKKSDIKKLKNGHGKLVDEVVQIAHSEIAKLPPAPQGKSYQPVVILFQRKKGASRKVKVMGATLDRKKLKRSGISL